MWQENWDGIGIRFNSPNKSPFGIHEIRHYLCLSTQVKQISITFVIQRELYASEYVPFAESLTGKWLDRIRPGQEGRWLPRWLLLWKASRCWARQIASSVRLWDETVVERRSSFPATSLPSQRPSQFELRNQTPMITNRVELRSLL